MLTLMGMGFLLLAKPFLASGEEGLKGGFGDGFAQLALFVHLGEGVFAQGNDAIGRHAVLFDKLPYVGGALAIEGDFKTNLPQARASSRCEAK